MKKVKLVDTASPIYKSIDFNYIFTKVLSEEVNQELSSRYGNQVRIEMERSGQFFVVLDRKDSSSPTKKDLEREVMDVVAEKYGDSYTKAKTRLAFIEGVNLRDIE